MNNVVVGQYEQAGAKVGQAISGMTPAERLAAPIPGKWSAHQVVIGFANWHRDHHLKFIAEKREKPGK